MLRVWRFVRTRRSEIGWQRQRRRRRERQRRERFKGTKSWSVPSWTIWWVSVKSEIVWCARSFLSSHFWPNDARCVDCHSFFWHATIEIRFAKRFISIKAIVSDLYCVRWTMWETLILNISILIIFDGGEANRLFRRYTCKNPLINL